MPYEFIRRAFVGYVGRWMPRNAPPPYREVTVSGPTGVREYRQTAAEQYNDLRVKLGSDRTVAAMLKVGNGSVGRWATGRVDVPYWVILRLRDLVQAQEREMDEHRCAAAARMVATVAPELTDRPPRRIEHPSRRDRSDHSAAQ